MDKPPSELEETKEEDGGENSKTPASAERSANQESWDRLFSLTEIVYLGMFFKKWDLFDFSSYETTDTTSSFNEPAAFLIDFFLQSKNEFAFIALCHLVSNGTLDLDLFKTEITDKFTEINVIKINTPQELQESYKLYLPDLRNCNKNTVRSKDEVWQFVCKGLFSITKSNNAKKNIDKFLRHLPLQFEANSVAHALKKELFVKMSFFFNSRANIRAFIVKWILSNASSFTEPAAIRYSNVILREWKGANMTHILLIREEIWEKRNFLTTASIPQLETECKIFEKIVLPHFEDKNFEYMRLMEAKDVFQGAAKRELPILTNLAVEFAKVEKPALKYYTVPSIGLEGKMAIRRAKTLDANLQPTLDY